MKTIELKNLRNKKVDELKKLVGEKRLEVAKTRAKIAAGQEKNLKKAKNLKKELVQALTLIKEMEIVSKLESKDPGPERLKGVEG